MDVKYNITIKVCVSGILLGGNFVLMAYFSVQSIVIYTCTLDIADLSEVNLMMYQFLEHKEGSKHCAVYFAVGSVLYIFYILFFILFFHHTSSW